MRRLLAALLVCAATPARATYSIVATDQASRQVGGAGTSCVGTFSVRIIYGSAPGHGAVHAQAFINTAGRDQAVVRLGMDVAPADILVEITDPAFDAIAARRQYGVVDLAGRAAAYTGDDNGVWAGDVQGAEGSFTFSAQGNILTGPEVVERAAAAFEAGGCDLADRLMLALEAGAENGEGDSRCTPGGIPSDAAFIQVDREGEAAGSWLVLDVVDTAPDSPLVPLRAAYDAWRLDNPCPEAMEPDAGPGPAADAGGPGEASSDDAGCGCKAGRARSAWPAALALMLLAMLVGISRRSGARPRAT